MTQNYDILTNARDLHRKFCRNLIVSQKTILIFFSYSVGAGNVKSKNQMKRISHDKLLMMIREVRRIMSTKYKYVRVRIRVCIYHSLRFV